MRFGEIKFMLKETTLKWNADNCLRLGASVSYYTMFSLFPLILVILAVARLLLEGSDAARGTILDALASVTGGFRTDFERALEAARQTRIAPALLALPRSSLAHPGCLVNSSVPLTLFGTLKRR